MVEDLLYSNPWLADGYVHKLAFFARATKGEVCPFARHTHVKFLKGAPKGGICPSIDAPPL